MSNYFQRRFQMKTPLPTDLFNLKCQFESWRKTRTKRTRTPDHLLKAAADLLDQYPVSTICRVCRINRVLFLRVEEIDWIEAAGGYVQVHTAGKTWLHRISLGELEAKLDARQFLRIHRSAIVNWQSIRELRPHSHVDFLVVLRDGTELKLSRSYRQKVEANLGQSL